MRELRSTLILALLFLLALLGYWVLDWAGAPTTRERLARAERVLPDLMAVGDADIARIEIDRSADKLAFDQRDAAPGRWDLAQPLQAAAASSRLITLAKNLIALQRSPDSGLLDPTKMDYGLEPPQAVIRVFKRGSSPGQPTAVLELGKEVRGMRYVRGSGQSGVDVVDAKLFSGLDDPITSWRERNLMAAPTFQIVKARVQSGKNTIALERGAKGLWNLAAPAHAPALNDKVESMLAALAAIRVEDDARGFVADNVQDLKPYGLDPPSQVVEIDVTGPRAETLRLEIGKPVPGKPDRVYARQGGQDDVVMIAAKPLEEIPTTALALRSKQVAEFDPGLAAAIELEGWNRSFELEKRDGDWYLKKPAEARADAETVSAFLKEFQTLEASEIFGPEELKDTGLAGDTLRVVIRERGRSEPSLALRLGRYDAVRKTIYVQLEDDPAVLAVPDQVLKVLPANGLGFREKTLLSVDPVDVRKLVIRRGSRVDELEPAGATEPNQWRMLRPVRARADLASVTRALATLRSLRAADLIAETAANLAAFTLDRPDFEITWETEKTHRLRVGRRAPGTSTFYAIIDDGPMIFTLEEETLKAFDAEFHDHLVLAFPTSQARRIVLRFQGRTLSLRKRQQPRTPNEWVDEPGQDISGLDLSRISSLLNALGNLQTLQFMQYEGPIATATGLHRPRLEVVIQLGEADFRTLRIGESLKDTVLATTGDGLEGAVFLLPAPSWNDLIRSAYQEHPIPAQPFAPAR